MTEDQKNSEDFSSSGSSKSDTKASSSSSSSDSSQEDMKQITTTHLESAVHPPTLSLDQLRMVQMTGEFDSPLTLRAVKEHKEDMRKQQMLELKHCGASDCLKNHDIKPEARAKEVDWMIKIVHKLQLRDKTFFKAVAIMDLYYKTSCT